MTPMVCDAATKYDKNYVKGGAILFMLEEVAAVGGNPNIPGISFISLKNGKTLTVFADSEKFIITIRDAIDQTNDWAIRRQFDPNSVPKKIGVAE